MYKILTIFTLSTFLFIGCGDGTTSISTTQKAQVIQGSVIDGYIKNATVWLDINKNGLHDNDEPQTTTNDDGYFTLSVEDIGEYNIISSGGVNISTNEQFNGELKSVIKTTSTNTEVNTTITPLSTIISNIYDSSTNNSLQEVTQQTADNLGLSVEQITKNPLIDKATFAVTQQIVQSIKILSKHIQPNEDDADKKMDLFTHIMSVVSMSIINDTSSTELNTSKIISSLEDSQYEDQSISIDDDVASFVQTYNNEIKMKSNETTSENTLAELETEFIKETTNKAEEKINDDKTSELEEILTLPSISSFTTNINEDINIGAVIGNITVSSIGDSAITSYTLSDNTNFAISNTGIVTTKTTFDYASIKSYALSVYASNSAGNSPSVAFSVSINDVADIVSSVSSFNTSINENTSIGTVIGNITVNSIGDSPITSYTLSDTNNFEISSSGEVTTNNTFDYESVSDYNLTMTASSDAGNSLAVDFNVSINDVADIVPTLSSFIMDIDENVTSGTLIGNITVSSIGDSPITSYTLSDTANFAISSTGVVTTKTTFDYESVNSYNLSVSARNSAGNSLSASFDVSINDISDVVPSISSFAKNINEDINIGTVIGNITVSSIGDSEITSYALSDNTNFAISNLGVVTTKTTFDYENVDSYSLSVSASNAAGTSPSLSFIINIIDIPDIVPTISSFSTSIDENTSIGTVIGNITVNSIGDSPTTSYTLSDTTNFEISSSGEVTTNNTFDYESVKDYNLTVTATSNAGTSSSVDFRVSIRGIFINHNTNASRYEAIRFLKQASLVLKEIDITYVMNNGYEAWIDNQFLIPFTTEKESLRSLYTYMNTYDPANFPTSLIGSTDNSTCEAKVVGQKTDFILNSHWWKRVLDDEDKLRQKMSYALSQLTVVSLNSAAGNRLYFNGQAIAYYYDLLQKNSFGNYRDLLNDVTHSPTMAYYLTYIASKKEAPDENYARELLQLFSIGIKELNLDGSSKLNGGKEIPTYTIEDVIDAAKVMSGWTFDGRADFAQVTLTDCFTLPIKSDPLHHDMTQKTILGKTIPSGQSAEEDVQSLLTILMNNDNMAPFISKQLIQRFTTSNPSPGYIKRVASVFNDDRSGIKGNLKAVVKAILLDIEARNGKTHYDHFGKFNELVVSLSQTLSILNVKPEHNITATNGNDYWIKTNLLFDQAPFQASSVFNFYYPDYTPNDEYFHTNKLVAPELQIQTSDVKIRYSNAIKNFLMRDEYYITKLRYPTPYASMEDYFNRGDGDIKYGNSSVLATKLAYINLTSIYNVFDQALDGNVDDNFDALSDATKKANAIKVLVDYLNTLLLGDAMETEYINTLVSELEKIRSHAIKDIEVYNIVTTAIHSILTSPYNMILN